MSKHIHGGENGRKKQVKFRADEGLIDALDDSLDVSRAEFFRQAIVDHLDDDATDADADLPDDDRLRDGYQRLRQVTGPNGRIDTDAALSTVAEATGVKKGAVKRTIIKPLDQRGYLTPRWGVITVHDPDERDTTDDDGDDRADSLGHTSPGKCIGHHPNADGTRCLKCDEPLGSEFEPDRCTCGTPLEDGERQCPNCRVVADEVEA
ncbi:hypothetical protein [Haloarchaeobius sp. DFWS5]|uniref:hypothetical protein n=1 Tax=Haloarchaeobius sp. DFWS5 TaxID=3446114 RepID=UPI003EB6BCE3